MRELSMQEAEQIGGGLLPLAVYAGTFMAAYGAAELITDFVRGFSDALAD